jgi:hypothetical protein
MKPKSKSTEPHISASKPATSEFGQILPTEWRVSGKTMTIDESIEDEAQHVNSTDLRVLKSFTDRLLDKLKQTSTDEYPGLHEAVHRNHPGVGGVRNATGERSIAVLVGRDWLCRG